MFVRTTHRRHKGQTYTNYVLVESVRTPKGPRQKVACSLGDLSPRPREQWLELARKVETALGGQRELVAVEDAEVAEVVERIRRGRPRRKRGDGTDLVSVHADRVSTEEHRSAGPVHVGVQYWRKLGLEEILRTIGFSERARVLTLAMTMNRLIQPCSEHAMPDWIRRSALADIRSRDLHHLVAARPPERNRWLAEFESDGFAEVIRQPSPLNPFQKKPKVDVKLERRGDETYVLCRGAGRVEKDRAIRRKQEQRLIADLGKLAARVEKGRLVKEQAIGEAIGRLKERYPRVARYYRIAYDAEQRTFRHEVDAEKYERAEKLDGTYLLRTDRTDLGAEEAWRLYILLTRAEDAFRDMKSPLSERPIFHHLERRVETHIFLCVLAYHLLVAVENTLLDKGVHSSWHTVRATLQTHQVCTVVLPTDAGAVLRIRKGSTPEPEHRTLYELLGVPLEVMRPRRSWVDPDQKCSD